MVRPEIPSYRHLKSLAGLSQIAAFACGLAIVTFLLTRSIAPFFANQPAAGASEAAFHAALDQNVPRILAHFHIPGLVVATVVGGAPGQTYAYGYADAASKRPMTVGTPMRVASISKSVTAWGIMRLVEAGKIDLDSPAMRYLGGWPYPTSRYPAGAVTVRELLNHTSGLSAGEDTFHDPGTAALSTTDLLREQARDGATLIAPAGSAYAYSVPGFTLLQQIIERQSGKPFADYMRDDVLQPLKMRASTYVPDQATLARISTSYVAGRPAPLALPQDQAADSLITTGPDLAQFVAAALPDPHAAAGAGVIAPSSVRHLYSAATQVPRFELAGLGQDSAALGYFVEPTPNAPTIVTNAGYDEGWSSQFFTAPATGDGVVIITNGNAGEPAIAQIGALWSSWRGLPPLKMVRAYRILGVDAAVVVGLVTMMTIALAADLAIELRAGRRRFADFHGVAVARSLLECSLAIATMGIWTMAKPTIQPLPTFSFVVAVTLISFASVVLARTVMPLHKHDKAPAQPKAARVWWPRRAPALAAR